MKTEFETEWETTVRSALVARAGEMPADGLARLAAADYRPRSGRLPTPARVGIGAGVLAGAATAGTALSVVLGGATAAYAGWSATPSATAAPSAAVSTSLKDTSAKACTTGVMVIAP